jgi:hypothetical protein
MANAAAVAIIVLVLVNILVSLRLGRSHMYSNGQRAAQFAIVWIVPFIGAALVWSFLREPRTSTFDPDLGSRNEFGDAQDNFRGESHNVGHGGDAGH